MKQLFAILSVAGMTAAATTGAMAQGTTQKAVLGASSNAVYSVRVEGANGVIYNCKPETTTTADGKPARECIREEDDGGAVFASGTGIADAAPAGAIVLVALAIAAGGGDDDGASATTTAESN